MNRVRCHKGWHKTRFCYFASIIQLLSKMFDAKFLCVKISRRTVVATSFLYLTVHRSLEGLRATSQSTWNLRLIWPNPSENADFDRFCLIVPQPWRLANKVQLLTNRKWPVLSMIWFSHIKSFSGLLMFKRHNSLDYEMMSLLLEETLTRSS